MSADDLATGIVDQPPPLSGPADTLSVQALVRADLEDRERLGVERYGTPLQPHNGRDALVDLYQELLDACCYIRQRILEERDGVAEVLRAHLRRCQDELRQRDSELQRASDLIVELRKIANARGHVIDSLKRANQPHK